VVDNNSTDGTREWIQTQNDIIGIFNPTNLGFPAGCNQGISRARGSEILLLNNDTIVTRNWLSGLRECLYSADDVGAVGPVSNSCSYYQNVATDYKDLNEMQGFSDKYRAVNRGRWEERIKLIGFCMLIKREIVDSVGLLDERFSPGNFEDDDYSFRIQQAGYRLLLCRDVFIHHYGSTTFKDDIEKSNSILQESENKFVDKWGFSSSYSCNIRYDLIQLMGVDMANIPIRVLEIGCACGATLLQIKNQFPKAELYGVELNQHAATLAQRFANIQDADVEKVINYPDNFFDYILLPDVLEHLYNPWSVLENLRRVLKDSGTIIASIPNTMHVSVVRALMQGLWTYTEQGLLDRTHIRFFTYAEIDKMFKSNGYSKITYSANILASPEDESWIHKISNIVPQIDPIQYKVYQYLVSAQKTDPIGDITT
jgi:ubiquinone/menaquinone biosynthesis C-methylase UbiE